MARAVDFLRCVCKLDLEQCHYNDTTEKIFMLVKISNSLLSLCDAWNLGYENLIWIYLYINVCWVPLNAVIMIRVYMLEMKMYNKTNRWAHKNNTNTNYAHCLLDFAALTDLPQHTEICSICSMRRSSASTYFVFENVRCFVSTWCFRFMKLNIIYENHLIAPVMKHL